MTTPVFDTPTSVAIRAVLLPAGRHQILSKRKVRQDWRRSRVSRWFRRQTLFMAPLPKGELFLRDVTHAFVADPRVRGPACDGQAP
jgi:hypothetical protein